MKLTTRLLAAFSAAFLFASCNKGGHSGLPIPADAAMVVHVNMPSLSKKLTWEEIRATEWFQDMYNKSKESNDSLQQKIMEDPSNSGVDIKSDFAFFMTKRGAGTFVVFEGHLKNADDFAAIVKKTNPGKEITKDGDFSFMTPSEEGGIMSWDDKRFILVGRMPNTPMSMGEDGSQFMIKPEYPADSLKQYVKGLFALESDKDLTSNAKYSDLLKEDGDVHFYMNTETYYGMMQSMSPATGSLNQMMRTFTDFMRGNISTGTFSFDDGKITMKSKQYLGEKMKAVMDKYKFEPVPESLISRIPSGNVAAAAVVNYPPAAVKEMLKAAGVDGFVNSYLGEANVSLDDLINATNGQMIFAVTDLGMKTVETKIEGMNRSFTSQRPDAKLLIAFSVHDTVAFNKLVNRGREELKKHEGEDAMQKMPQIYSKGNTEWFVLSNDPAYVDRFLAGSNEAKPFADKIKGHPMGMYVDIRKIFQGFGAQPGTSGIIDASMNMWEDVVMVGGDYKDGVSTSEFTVNLVEKKTNSLKQINAWMQKMYDAQKKQRQDMMRQYQLDEPGDEIVSPIEQQ